MAQKTLFDHLKNITEIQDPKYWDSLSESDRKTFSNYMVFRFLSMNPDWVQMIAQIQPYLQEVPPKALYLALIDLLPKTKSYLRYMKPKDGDKYEKWLVELVSKYYEVSMKESEDYLKILYSNTNGQIHIKEICEKYGTDQKTITKLKLKIK